MLDGARLLGSKFKSRLSAQELLGVADSPRLSLWQIGTNAIASQSRRNFVYPYPSGLDPDPNAGRAATGRDDIAFKLWQTQLVHQLQELHLIQCSLLPGEHFTFLLPSEDLAKWKYFLDAFTDAISSGLDADAIPMIASLTHPPCQARFELRVADARVWFEVELSRCTEPPLTGVAVATSVSVKGAHASRDAHERWKSEIHSRAAEIDDACEFPVYELLTLLTATLHESEEMGAATSESRTRPETDVPAPTPPTPTPLSPIYHTLLTSHHLLSPTKRRSMHHWSSQLGLTSGFAKVGYPGVIYAEGPREAVEAFVRNVKGMQWLALRVRFVEPVPVFDVKPESVSTTSRDSEVSRWIEVSKISEVLEQMRIRGKESLVTNLGIGASSRETKRE